MKSLQPLLVTGAALLLSGCISTTTVTKIADPDNSTDRGLRYSLPVTMLLVQPQGDGSATYTWVYPPDPNNTYAITQQAFLSKFTLDVTVANGLLSKVNSQNDATALPAKLFDSAQTAFAGAETKKAADAKTKAAAVTAAQTVLASAALALDQANADVTLYATGTDDQKLAAKVKVSDAQIAYNHALTAVQSAQSSADAPAVGSGPTAAKQYGPVLFMLVSEGSSQHLRAVNVQVVSDTVIPATAPAASTGAAATTWTLTPEAGVTYTSGTKPLIVRFNVAPGAKAVDQGTSGLVDSKTLKAVKPLPAFSIVGDKVVLTFANGLPAGKYTASPALSATVGGTPNSGTANFTVQ
jgi:hypothetical protein